ncbi:AAA family ATPase [Hwangdonia seohaensis]|uniref:MoxR family ATPase n=1 Tax=Hwangdonia seohaensis TaxID=1240727 RepID=A0ABW3RAR7_9FLAO|nr:MoxR family ATPase [Hwangdonia seohaensis]
MKNFNIYKGESKLGTFEPDNFINAPQNYIPSKGLINAVNVAISLGQPLLLTGEPGTGKSHLAYSIAHELNLGKPLVFRTKTTSTSRDLFYTYDALSHFRSVQTKQNLDINTFIREGALGAAIKSKSRKVVLIDEIDKAPRDLPNDILNEIESLSFEVAETGAFFESEHKNRPIVIMTSNSEKNLPDAFLRRCIFYHLPFPSSDELLAILDARLTSEFFNNTELEQLIKHFLTLRQKFIKRKKPATAELLSWLQILEQLNFKKLENINEFDKLSEEQKELLLISYSVLAKTSDDFKDLKQKFVNGNL